MVEICNDKWKTYEFCMENNICVPKTYKAVASVKQDVLSGELKFPVVIKPRWGMGSIGIFEDMNIVLTNTGGDHSDLTDQYASIRVEMEEVAKLFGAKKLRKVKESDFYQRLPEIQEKVSGRAIMRAMHYFDENKRVDLCAKAVKNSNEKKFCAAINESGMSSYLMLQNCYPLSDTAQRIPLGINLSKK